MTDEEEDFLPDDDLAEASADDTADVSCPYCGEIVEIALDPGGGSVQEYVEDCEVCCRPWHVKVLYGRDGTASVTLGADDEGGDPE